ncbi:hypothetical protein EZ449_17985 [Pedobacter frigidisoli]|uniref:Addiction module component n=1 Tax=Pedobacter frigidisoli TaxID=2530455 RepID=A0A4R0NVG2_9SPHI|nr:hypothetical protein [Pedobacter frigidisoli]TCD04198.1 hypothetical protein EZ449_17985 [Pedobacter frigidisoli]
MEKSNINFDTLVDTMYNLPLEDRLELKDLLEQSIADSRRNEIEVNIKAAKKEHKTAGLKFSSDINQLKKML